MEAAGAKSETYGDESCIALPFDISVKVYTISRPMISSLFAVDLHEVL